MTAKVFQSVNLMSEIVEHVSDDDEENDAFLASLV